jgi:integrase
MKKQFAQIAALWKEDKRRYVKESSYATYIQLLNGLIMPFFADREPAANCVQEFADSLLERGLAPKTVKDTVLVLKMVLRFGAALGAWPHIDCKVRYPSVYEKRPEVAALRMKEQLRLQSYLRENLNFKNLGIMICLYSGLRIGEVCALQWKDIDIAVGVIHVSKTVQRVYLHDGDQYVYALRMGSPKTVSSMRDIPILKEFATLIRPVKRMMKPDCFVVSGTNTPLEPRYLRDYYHRLLERLKIRRLRFHALRHSFATRCIESGCDYKTVSAILGHSSISTTLDLYVHPDTAQKRRCLERMSRHIRA